MAERSRRLDSWKEIAEYLGRDVRTAMRWAKAHGLPVRRVGGSGRTVFAFNHEIDAWLGAGSPDVTGQPPSPALPAAAALDSAPAGRPRRVLSLAVAAAAGVTVVAAALAVWRATGDTQHAGLRVIATNEAVSLSRPDGRSRRIYEFTPDVSPVLTAMPARLHDADANGLRDVLVGISSYVDHPHRAARSGELINLSADGRIHWRFRFDDAIAFRDERFDGPWSVSDWTIEPASAPARIAVAAHHHTWWASLAAVLDHDGRRVATFVNPGWIEGLLWIDARRLAASGFNNARNAAMLALVDASQARSGAPGSEGTPYDCGSCGDGAVLFYATFPRSELNLLTGARFNRARVSREEDRIIVRTLEIDDEPLVATAIYTFDKDLRLQSAQYEDAYWTIHERLAREGRLTHTRASCPEQKGPREIAIWSGTGWQPMAPES